MKKFVTKTYHLPSPQMKKNTRARFAVLADLHGLVFGEKNCDLTEAVRVLSPDAVLAVGDMLVRGQQETMEIARELLCTLAKEFPVYYSLGNHEYGMAISEERRAAYEEYEEAVKSGGVHVLRNTCEMQMISGEKFWFHGLEIPIEYYQKPSTPKLSLKTMEELIGTPSEKGVHVLLAHNPKYGKTYFSWGADLILSGHYHGGVLRLSEHRGLTCPQFLLFPPYCCGDFRQGSRYMIVSAGIGEHTIPIRIHNPRELLLVEMKSLEN